MSAQWWIKHHAAERWIERFRPELTVEEASADLARLVSECVEVARAVADGRREYLHPAWPEACPWTQADLRAAWSMLRTLALDCGVHLLDADARRVVIGVEAL